MRTRSGTSMATPPTPATPATHADSRQAEVTMTDILVELKSNNVNNNIPLYSGTRQGSAQIWMKDYERLARLKRWDDNTKALSLPLFLDGTARHWIDSVEDSVQDNWAELKAQFIDKHKLSQGEKIQKMDECDRRKQQDNESVEDYLMAMSKLARDIGESDDYIYMAAMRGINRKYKEQVIYQRPTTFSELLVAAKFVEGIHRSIHDEMPKYNDREMAAYNDKMSPDLKNNRRGNRSRPYSRGTAERREYAPRRHDCQRCGRSHDHRQCPAWGKKCHACGNTGHFSNVCRRTGQHRSERGTNQSAPGTQRSTRD